MKITRGLKMEQTIKINIKNNGVLIGTCGWLAKCQKSISVGNTKDGNRGAWLVIEDGDNKYSILLAIQNWNDSGQTEVLSCNGRGQYCELDTGIYFTDAAFSSLKNLAEEMAEYLEKMDSGEKLILKIA